MDGFVALVVGLGGKSLVAETTLEGLLSSVDANVLGQVAIEASLVVTVLEGKSQSEGQ